MIQGVYLAYPIDQRGPASLVHLYQQIEEVKRRIIDRQAAGWVFDPGDAFHVNTRTQIDDTLPRINRAALNNSDLVIAWVPAGVATIGVPMEIDRAVSQGKNVIIFSDAKAWMLNYPHGRVTRFDTLFPESDMEWDLFLSVIYTMQPPPESRMQEPLMVVGEGGALPTRQYDDDAGLDLYVSTSTVIAPGAFSDVPCGVRVVLPPWSWGLVTGRSSALRSKGLLVHSGVIDAGYRGPLFAGAWNMTDEPVEVKEGERIAQLILLSNSTRWVRPEFVSELPDSERGTNGFGSTGS